MQIKCLNKDGGYNYWRQQPTCYDEMTVDEELVRRVIDDFLYNRPRSITLTEEELLSQLRGSITIT